MDLSHESDEVLAKEVQNGNSDAFTALVGRYEEKLLRYARKFLARGEDNKDLVQEVFLKAYVNIKSFDVSQKFSPWIYRIAHNEFINGMKKRIRLPLFVFDFDTILPHPASGETADGDFQKKELREMLDKCLDKLDVKYREPLVLYYFEELSYQEIADILRIPVATVGVRIARGKKALQTILKTV
jgi:RNA polymerase sigma-70 factor (ECF subfamily)